MIKVQSELLERNSTDKQTRQIKQVIVRLVFEKELY